MFFRSNHIEKVKEVKVKPKKTKDILPYDELLAEKVGYKNQFIERVKYIFKDGKAVECYNELESDNPIFIDATLNAGDNLHKNVQLNGNVLSYEWNDKYFEEKGKGCSKSEIKKFLKALGYKIK